MNFAVSTVSKNVNVGFFFSFYPVVFLFPCICLFDPDIIYSCAAYAA